MRHRVREIERNIEDLKVMQREVGREANEEEIMCVLALRDERDALQQELVNTLEKDEVDYFVNTAPILFNYYDIVEKGKDEQASTSMNNNILKFFVASSKEPEEEIVHEPCQVDRASLLEKYMCLTDDNYVKNVEGEPKERCLHCGSMDRNIMMNEGFILCNGCHNMEYILIDHERPSYKEVPREVTYFSYKRINHLNEFCRVCAAVAA